MNNQDISNLVVFKEKFYGDMGKDRGHPRYYRYEIYPIYQVFKELYLQSDCKIPKLEQLYIVCLGRVEGYTDWEFTQASELFDAVYYIYPYLVRLTKFIELLRGIGNVELVGIYREYLFLPIQIWIRFKGSIYNVIVFEDKELMWLNNHEPYEISVIFDINECKKNSECIPLFGEKHLYKMLYLLSEKYNSKITLKNYI